MRVIDFIEQAEVDFKSAFLQSTADALHHNLRLLLAFAMEQTVVRITTKRNPCITRRTQASNA